MYNLYRLVIIYILVFLNYSDNMHHEYARRDLSWIIVNKYKFNNWLKGLQMCYCKLYS